MKVAIGSDLRDVWEVYLAGRGSIQEIERNNPGCFTYRVKIEKIF